MSQEESGGIQGLRAWARDAAERVKRLIAGLGGGAVPSGAHDASVAELEQLAQLLDQEADVRGSVDVWLAGALTMRHAEGKGAPADRVRAEKLLRDARDRTTPSGATVSEEDRRWAALFLLTHVSPIQPQQGAAGGAPDLSAFLDWATRTGPAGMTTVVLEIKALMADVVELPLPHDFLRQLRQFEDLLSAPTGPGLSDLLTGMMPAGSVFTDQLRRVTDRISTTAGTPTVERADVPGAVEAPDPAPSPDPEPSQEQEQTSASAPEPAPEKGRKPKLTPDDLRHMVTAMDAVHATTTGLDDVLKSGDPEALNELLGRLRSVQDLPLVGENSASALESLRALLLAVSPGVGGTFQDRSAGRARMDTIVGHMEKIAGSLPPELGDPTILGRVLELYSKVLEAGESEDTEALRGLVTEAETLDRSVPEGQPFRFLADWALGAAYGRLGAVTRDKDMLLRSLPFLEKGAAGAEASGLPLGDTSPLPKMPDFDLLRAGLTGEPVPVPDHVPPPPGASADELYRSTLSLSLRVGLDRDPAVLDVLIGELERLRDEVRQGRAPRIAADALWQLAEAYHLRRILKEDTGDTASLEAVKEALVALAADVLLQTGAEHGLLAARAGASRGVRAARWAASHGKLHEAVAALELGRALVLQAASTSSAVPELLETAGRGDLAEAWRAAESRRPPESPQTPVPPGPGPADPGEAPGMLPSTLRRQALDALGYRGEGGLLGTPTLSELADGVAEAGADALLYLVPGEDEEPGLVLVVAPELGAAVGALPLLSGSGSGPLERYLDAAALPQEQPGDESAAKAWEEALEVMCDWAFQALAPVLGGIEDRLTTDRDWDDQPLRVVLVPCGRLGVVPWHAARFPPEAAHDHLCRTTVISYAASGSQFLRTVRRAPRDPVSAPVLVADPLMDLTYAETEVTALRDAFYPQARLCGELYDAPPGKLMPGTPDAVLGYLADGASLLHVVSHGSAGTRPTVSALDLAPAEGGGTGKLTVTRLLDHEERHDSADGPLIVLSACQTDLSKRDHDEALTLTTAFVAGGARDVVGSRWLAQDSGSALLMAVFHHYLVVDGLSPGDALRAAQLWMLDPSRENPGSLRGELLREMRRPGLDRIGLWAAFIHQGHPGPGTARKGEGTA
ncbi:CHAT domain-containing protein [Streptomyces sp. NBC_01520]|uniref:CHAT domain-containing protein n=1 Tax=Streptomyces sp. NBC_01520 TaxID=2903892 RepID=UPI00386E40E0